MKRISLPWFQVIVLVISLNVLSCNGSSGGGGSSSKLLDTSFGAGGKVTTPIGTIDDTSYALVIQSDGKLVAAGYNNYGSDITIGPWEFALVRYNTDGSLDTSFGIGGIVTTDINGIDDEAFALAIQSDGKIVAAGYTDTGSQVEFALVRYNTDGSLDTTFNPTGTIPGVVTTVVGSDDAIRSLVIQPSDGKLVVAGYSLQGVQYEFALARYNTDGSLDTTGFNPTGTVPGAVTTAIGTNDDTAYALAIQSDDMLVAAGYSAVSSTQFEFALVRYNPAGSLDTTFNPTGTIPGVVTTVVGTDDAIKSLVIQPSDGKLVVAGYSLQGVQYEFALARYNTDGSLDTTGFNPTGTIPGAVTTAIGTNDDTANGLVIQPDGKLVAAGYTSNSSGTQFKFALVAYNTDGTLDTTFNKTGELTTTVGNDDAALALIIQVDGKLVAAGYSLQSGQYEFALVRYLPLS